MSPTLCQQENGGKKAICKTRCVLMNMQIDGHTTLVAAKTSLGAGLTGKKKKEAASLLWGQFMKSTNDFVNTSFCLRQTLYFIKAFIPFVKQK